MWGRSLFFVGTAVLGFYLAASVTGRAAARPNAAPVPAAELRIIMEGPEAGKQVSTADPEQPLAPVASPDQLTREQRLVSDAVSCLTRARDLELEPGGPTRSLEAAWSGRHAVELLAEARERVSRSARGRSQLCELLITAGREANTGLRSPDGAVRLTGLDRALRSAREAFELLR